MVEMANKECQIFFSFDNNYVQTAKVALYSLLNKINKYIKLDLFILHNNITYGNQLKLLKITSLL